MSTDLYFSRGNDLVEAVRWVTDSDKEANLPANSPKTYVQLVQTAPDRSVATGYGKGDTWLARNCNSSGIVDTQYLLDGEDLCNRIGQQEVFKNYSLILSATKRKKVKLQSVTEMENSDNDVGITEVGCYAGDTANFVVPEVEWVEYGYIADGWEFRRKVKLNQDLSGLSRQSDSPAFLRFKEHTLSIISGERNGVLNGVNMVVTEMSAVFNQDISFAIKGRQLSKIADVFDNEMPGIAIYVDNLDEPTRVMFKGNMGYINMPVVDAYTCQALSIGGLAYFYGEGIRGYEELCSRDFLVDKLAGFTALQVPPKNDGDPGVVLDMANNKLTVRKPNDSHEASTISPWGFGGEGEWIAYKITHSLLVQSLDTMEKFITAKVDEETRLTAVGEFEDAPPPLFKIVTLKQARIGIMKKQTHVLYLESPDFKDCRVMLIASIYTPGAKKSE